MASGSGGSARHRRARQGHLSGVLGLAVRHDALDANPVRDLTPARSEPSSKPPVLTESGWDGLRAHLVGSSAAGKHDLRDLTEILSGPGCRTGEPPALDWPRIDDVVGTIAIEGTVIRVTGEGLFVQSHTRSGAGMRTTDRRAG